ncbi:MAG: hypothetical protein LBS70_00065, partial [Candidatus Accumulibacter sp.]|nr:hypothetical protein [Accumulibacter sp.]
MAAIEEMPRHSGLDPESSSSFKFFGAVFPTRRPCHVAMQGKSRSFVIFFKVAPLSQPPLRGRGKVSGAFAPEIHDYGFRIESGMTKGRGFRRA